MAARGRVLLLTIAAIMTLRFISLSSGKTAAQVFLPAATLTSMPLDQLMLVQLTQKTLEQLMRRLHLLAPRMLGLLGLLMPLQQVLLITVGLSHCRWLLVVPFLTIGALLLRTR